MRRTPGPTAGHGKHSSEPASGPGVSWGQWSWWVCSFFPHCFLCHCRGFIMPLLLQLLKHHGRKRHTCRRCPFPWAVLRPSLAPWEVLSFHWCCWGVLILLSPATSLSLHFLLDPSSILRAPASSTLWTVQKEKLKLGFYGVLLPPGASWDLSGLSPMWDELQRSIKVPYPWQGDP